jgi:cell division inhibitor SulA
MRMREILKTTGKNTQRVMRVQATKRVDTVRVKIRTVMTVRSMLISHHLFHTEEDKNLLSTCLSIVM